MREWQKRKPKPFGQRRRQGGGRRDSFGSKFREAPVKVGDQYDVEIIDVGKQGDGLTKVKDFIIFVKGTQKGDKVRIAITEIRGKSAVGEVVPAVEEGQGVTEEGLSEEVAEAEESAEEGETI